MALTPTLLLAGIEKTINALLARDPASPSRLRSLAGQRVLMCLETPRVQLALCYHAQGLDLLLVDEVDEGAWDAIVELDSDTLGRLAGGADMERMMFEGRLAVRGKIHLLEATRDMLLDLDLDWEAELARVVGDLPAHQLAEGLRGLSRWGLRTHRELCADVSEYVFEEARWLPGRHQLEAMREALTELELATDRTEARLKRLNRRLARENDVS